MCAKRLPSGGLFGLYTMIVDAEVIQELFRKIEGFRTEVRKAGGDPTRMPVSIEDMRIVASRILGMRIDAESVSFEADHLCSMVERGKAAALISIRSDLTESQERAAFTKELCHLLFDPPESWSTDVVETINSLSEHKALEIADRQGNVLPKSKAVFVEEIALFSTTELLYPREKREAHRGMLDRQEISYRKLAMEMKIPHWTVCWPYAKWYKALEVFRPAPCDCCWP